MPVHTQQRFDDERKLVHSLRCCVGRLKRKPCPAWPVDKDDTDAVTAFMNTTLQVCRPCHSAIHSAHTEYELAEKYFTREALLADPTISKFCSWAERQKGTSVADARNPKLRYRR
jgi:hypothetical protein